MKVKAASFKYIINNILKGYFMLSSPKIDVERKCLMPYTGLLGRCVHGYSAHITDSAIKILVLCLS